MFLSVIILAGLFCKVLQELCMFCIICKNVVFFKVVYRFEESCKVCCEDRNKFCQVLKSFCKQNTVLQNFVEF